MTGIILDFERAARCGIEEAVFCESKTPQQISDIITLASNAGQRLLLTRLSAEKLSTLPEQVQTQLNYDPDGWTATFGPQPECGQTPRIAIVSGGTSDHHVCSEAANTLHYHGYSCQRFEDVGIAGLWRLMKQLEEIKKADIIITVAGMEAALPTVLAGLVANPIIAVPTSVGYGVATGGHLALQSMLGSCASGLTVVNIDNGFGAACAAIRLLNQFKPR
ncbi:hypothetical protein FHU10_0848 [Serratia fonticola]|jgi:NCAIR mutase (PurE)-related protein|uniref:PurE domain-containing protein n=1 Tax=Serratia fonticola TaxID=47917 RepID=A0A542BKI7_SERFO|nr:nickel pincer cofactor biosynthesis protein LarB [Serratia fonticola]TQI79088.1 hypothetical protein FHU09_1600 [Serratia fonticola]TQI98890.1 hypothetical protein FHU11_4450 [Serratia fonticola]TVZ68415.1 hypothetical protein FHU10_0848 [Serratia fonticola]